MTIHRAKLQQLECDVVILVGANDYVLAGFTRKT
jgi:hypothetical protein